MIRNGKVQGWTPDGRQVDLTLVQVEVVAWLLDPQAAAAPPTTGRGSGWSTAVATAAAYERRGYERSGPYGREVADQLRAWLETPIGAA